MKISKRTLIMTLSLVLALSVSAFGTVAYMTDRTSVKNTFTIGGIDITVDETDTDAEDPDPTPTYPDTDVNGDDKPDDIEVAPDGTITIDPTPDNPEDTDKDIVINPNNPDPTLPDKDGDGKPEIDIDGDDKPDVEIEVDPDTDEIIITPIDPETGDPTGGTPTVIKPNPVPETPRTEEGNDYELIPGLPQTKDPRVTVELDSEECYVRMRVIMNCYSIMADITGKTGVDVLGEFVEINNGWLLWTDSVVIDNVADTLTCDFWYKQAGATDSIKVDASTEAQILPTLFDTFTTPEYFEPDDFGTLKKNGVDFELIVEGHAIQTASFNSDIEAWNAFDNQVFGKENGGNQ